MSAFIEIVRKAVVLVLLMELVLQLQPGKNYEPYLKMLVGLMMTYSLVTSILGVFGKFQGGIDDAFPGYDWVYDWSLEPVMQQEDVTGEQEDSSVKIELIEIPVEEIKIEKIEVERIENIP